MRDRTVLIRNGNIIDGTGQPSYPGHVFIRNQRIESILAIAEKGPVADVTIDAAGCCVAPGFIDMHSHADWLLPTTDHPKLLKCYLEQGVTTVVGGNCGFSPAPINPIALDCIGQNLSALLTDKPLSYDWQSMKEFLFQVENARPLLNIAELVGHGTIRSAVTGSSTQPMTARETEICCEHVKQAFTEGACGISFGLGYEPGMYSSQDEIEAFCKVAHDHDKPVTVHLKALSRISPTYSAAYLKPHNLRALKEILTIATHTKIKLQLSHFIFVGRNSWSTATKALELVEDARRKGLDVMIDAFPFTCGNTTINVLFPYWFLRKLPQGYQSRIARGRLRLELELGFRLVGFIYKDFQAMNISIEAWQHLNGLNLEEIAAKWHTSPFDALLRISQKTNGEALMLFHTYSGVNGCEEVLEKVLSHNLCLFETDAIVKSSGHPNPASLGTFPKILGTYARDKKLFSLEEAVRRMTSASAARFGFKDRGRIEKGNAADIVVFDPKTIGEMPAEGNKPAGKPTGIRHVFINGTHTVKDGAYIDATRAGVILA